MYPTLRFGPQKSAIRDHPVSLFPSSGQVLFLPYHFFFHLFPHCEPTVAPQDNLEYIWEPQYLVPEFWRVGVVRMWTVRDTAFFSLFGTS